MTQSDLYPLSDPAARKAQIVARMQAQRELWQLNRAAASTTRLADAPQGDASVDGESEDVGEPARRFTDNPLVRAAVEHPLAAAGIAGVLLMLGPRRLLRMSGWLLPLILRR